MKRYLLLLMLLVFSQHGYCWGFFGHRKINAMAIFLLPPEMLLFYKPNASFITEHAVDPDKRRYAVAQEGARHFIDIDYYGHYPFDSLPRRWDSAVHKFSADTLQAHGIVPWYVQTMLFRLTNAFREKNGAAILKYSAEIGHYIADAHVPLHASSNHNGQLTGQAGIHGFWESRIPELLADSSWDFFIGHAAYISSAAKFIWARVLESAAAADTVLAAERWVARQLRADQHYSFELRNGQIIRQYSSRFTRLYDKSMNGMVERRMRAAIFAVASFWYTAWVDAGQPDLSGLGGSRTDSSNAKGSRNDAASQRENVK